MNGKTKIKILISLTALITSNNAFAGSVIIDGQKLKSYDEISNYGYQYFKNNMDNVITSKTMSKLDLEKINGNFIFISPPIKNWKDNYIWVKGGLIKPSEDSQLLLGYLEQLKAEMLFFYFEKMGLVRRIDVVDESSSSKKIENNYDFIITIRSDYNGKRDAKAANARKTEYYVKNVKTGKEKKFTETMGSPNLVGNFEQIAVKFTDAINEIK